MKNTEQYSFDPGRHVHRINGRVVPGVTTILSDCGLTDAKWAKDEHRDRGTAVHELAAEIAMMERPESTVMWDGTCSCDLGEGCTHKVSLGYGQSFLKGIRALKFVVEPGMSEFPVWSLMYTCAGIIDLWGFTGKFRTMIDIKSGRPQDGVAIQLAGYRVLARESRGIESDVSYALWLDKDGGMPKVVQPERPREDERTFQSVVETWHWRKAHGMLQRGPNGT